MTDRCTWCEGAPRYRDAPEGFCSAICQAYYKAACADLGMEQHRLGLISIERLRQRFAETVRAGPPLVDGGAMTAAIIAAIIAGGALLSILMHALLA